MDDTECIFQTELTHFLGSTNPCPTAVHMEPFPTSVSKFSFEYLLLPPRSALKAASLDITVKAASQPSRPPTRQDILLILTVEYG